MVELFNFFYFFFILLMSGAIVGLYFLLRSKSERTQRLVLFSLLVLNLALHFSKPLFPPYSEDPALAMSEVWFTNVCGTSVLFFPFIFLSESRTAKDYMVYLGIVSGFLALLYPTEAIGKSVLTPDLWRFYLCHGILLAVPLLTVLWGLHRPDVRRIWKIPFCAAAMLLFIIANQVLQSELGIIPLRGDDLLNVSYRNPSLIWGPTDDVAVLFSWLTPSFMKTVPAGPYAGQEKYWPFFWMLPGVLVYFLLLPLLLCLILDFGRTKATLGRWLLRFCPRKKEK
ncbi:MAG: YwaF family protein [Clostridia bacterium]|nr:YwaF family protein [Clostridia bacterium]